MTKEDTFNAWVGSSNVYGAFFALVAKEVGMEKALKMHATVGGPFGDQMGKALKDELAGKKLNVKALNKVMSPMYAGWGFEPEIKVGPKSLTLRIDKCPQYEGFRMAGLDDKTIEKMCTASAKTEYDAINKYYAELEGKIKFRKSPKDACIEEITIK